MKKLGVLEDLAADLLNHDECDADVAYTPFLIEGNDVGGIDVGFLVRETVAVDAIIQLGLTETFVNPLTGEDNILHDRPPLLLEGRVRLADDEDSDEEDSDAFPLSVMVVHNRSLSRVDDPVDGPRVRQKRLEQALSIAQKVQDLQNADLDVALAVIGDVNAFQFTDGFVDVVGQIKGDFDPAESLLSGPGLVEANLENLVDTSIAAAERYSFIFRGNAHAIDDALISQGLEPFVRGAEYARGNVDSAFDLFNDETTWLRSSDHDGLVLFVRIHDDDDD